MSVLVESLKRLYKSGRLSEEKITELCKTRKITENEKKYILS